MTSIVAVQAEAALDMARDDNASKRRSLDDIHRSPGFRWGPHGHGSIAQGKPGDSIAIHSKIAQVGSQEGNLSPLAEKLRISERQLCQWLPNRMKTIEPAK